MADSYSKQEWKRGDVITASRLNAMDDGIFNAINTTNNLTTSIVSGTDINDSEKNNNNTNIASTAYVKSAIDATIDSLDYTDSEAAGTKYVSAVEETNGKIAVTHTVFSPTVTVEAGTTSTAPTVNITVAGNTATAQPITIATTAVYGVTKLSSATNSDSENVAATAKAIKDTYDFVSTVSTTASNANNAAALAVRFTQNQGLTNAQKAFARENIKAQDIGNAITPEQYEAKGDGVTDDTDAMKIAVYAAYTNKVPLVLSYGKTYAIKDELWIYGRIRIYGNGATIKVIDKRYDGSIESYVYLNGVINFNDTNGQFPDDPTGRGCIEDLVIDCNGFAGYGIYIMTAKGFDINGVDVCNFTHTGIQINSGFECFVRNVRCAGAIHYNTTRSYEIGNRVVYNQKFYVCTAATSGAFDATKWTEIAPMVLSNLVGLGSEVSDSFFENVVTMNVGIGIENKGFANFFRHIHSWNFSPEVIPTSVMIDTYHDAHITESYVDTCAIAVKISSTYADNQYASGAVPVIVNGLKILHGGSSNLMTPEIMGSVVPTIFSIPFVQQASRIYIEGLIYNSLGEPYNLFNMDVSGYIDTYLLKQLNDSTINSSNFGNYPSANYTIPLATTSTSGLMSGQDKTDINNIIDSLFTSEILDTEDPNTHELSDSGNPYIWTTQLVSEGNDTYRVSSWRNTLTVPSITIGQYTLDETTLGQLLNSLNT